MNVADVMDPNGKYRFANASLGMFIQQFCQNQHIYSHFDDLKVELLLLEEWAQTVLPPGDQ